MTYSFLRSFIVVINCVLNVFDRVVGLDVSVSLSKVNEQFLIYTYFLFVIFR